MALASALVLALSCAPASSAADGKSRVTHVLLAAAASPAPDGGTYLQPGFSGFTLNARGQVAFDALLGGPSTSGVFVADGRRTSTIALGGNPDPAAGNFAFVSAPFITAGGDVVFLAVTVALSRRYSPPISSRPAEPRSRTSVIH
jgi:hypothetical protein